MIVKDFTDASVLIGAEDFSGIVSRTRLQFGNELFDVSVVGHATKRRAFGQMSSSMKHQFYAKIDIPERNWNSALIEIRDGVTRYGFVADTISVKRTGEMPKLHWFTITASGTGRVIREVIS